jgi:hypothetical protein
MFLKISLFVFMLALCILYLEHTETFYIICDKISKESWQESLNSQQQSENFLKEGLDSPDKIEKFKKIMNLCKEFNTDYSTHKLMKYTLKILDDFVYNTNIESYEEFDLTPKNIGEHIKHIDLNSFKFTLYATKFIHIFMYSIIIYISIVSVPNILAQLVLYFVNKILYIIFFILLVEAFMKIWFKIDSDIVTIVFGNGPIDFLNIPIVKQIIESMAYPLKLIKAVI